MCEKVSDVDLLDKHDASVINSFDSIYGKAIINTGEKKLNIKNDFLENSMAASWSKFQILASNYDAAGYTSPEKFVKSISE